MARPVAADQARFDSVRRRDRDVRGIATRVTFSETADLSPIWSPDGGRHGAALAPDGNELVYRDRSGAIVAVDVIAQAATVESAVPRRLFTPALGTTAFGVAPDGPAVSALDARLDADDVAGSGDGGLNWSTASASASR